jgi:hypothetical protein
MKVRTILLVTSLLGATAHAASGTAVVTMKYWEKNGGYCAASLETIVPMLSTQKLHSTFLGR